MKTIKLLIVSVMAVCFIAGLAFVLFAGPPPAGGSSSRQPGPSIQPTYPGFKCPQGWKKKPGVYACVPVKPSVPLDCPDGYSYYESECEVGCKIFPK